MSEQQQAWVKYPMLGLALGLAIGLYTVLVLSGQPHSIAITGAITMLVGTMWVKEAIPIPVTTLIPFVAFPMAGILTHREAASA